MHRSSRKSINPRDSFHLPRHSDFGGDISVNADELQNLRDISVAARPSLMPSPDGSAIIPENSDVSSAELKRRFRNDPEWFQRLPRLSQPSFTPRAQTKTLRRTDGDVAAEVSLSTDQSEEQASVSDAGQSFRKPFRKKKQLYNSSQVFDKALDDTTFTEKDSQSERSSREASKVALATRRSNRLALRSKAVTDPESPVGSPRESFRRWKSTESLRPSSALSNAIQELRSKNAIIDESSESSSAADQRKSSASGDSHSASHTEGRKTLKLGIPSEVNKEVSGGEASFASPPARRKPFGNATKSRLSVGALLDETSDSTASAAQSPRTTSNVPSATTEDVSGIEDTSRHELFARKPREKRRGSSLYKRIMDADDSQQSVDESRGVERSTTKSAENRNPVSRIGSRNLVAEESPTFTTGHKPFGKTRHQQRQSSAFADALESEDSHSLSAAETEIVGGSPVSGKAAAVKESPPSVANDSQSRRRGQLSSSSAVGMSRTSNLSSKHNGAVEAVDHVSPGVGVDDDVAESARFTSLTERRERKSRRSSALVAVMDDNLPLSEVAQLEDPHSAQSSPKRRRLEQEVSSEHDTPPPTGIRGWAVAKEKGRLDEYDNILSMDTSSIVDVETAPDYNAKGFDRKAVPVVESDFILPAIPPKRSSLLDRLSQRGTPHVVIVPLRGEACTSTPTPNATKMVVSSPISSIKKSSNEPFQDPVSSHSDREVSTEAPSQPTLKNTSSRPSGAADNSHGDLDCSVENDLTKHKSLPKINPMSFSENDILARRSVNTLSEVEDAQRISPNSKLPPKRESMTSQQVQSRTQSPRQIARSVSAEKSQEEDDVLPSTAQRAVTSPKSKSPPQRKSTASEQSLDRRQSSRQRARSVSAKTSSEEDEDLPSTAERILPSPNAKSPTKRKSTALEQSRNRRQSSCQMARSVSAEKSREEEDENLPSTAERTLPSSNDKSPTKRKSLASEQSLNRRQSLRQRARSISAEKSLCEDEDLPSTAERILPSPNAKSPTKRKSTALEQSRNRRQSSRQMARSVPAEFSEEDYEDEDVPSSAESVLSPSLTKSPSKRKFTPPTQLHNRKQLSRQEKRPSIIYNESSGVEKEEMENVPRSSQSKSPSSANRKSTPLDQERREKRQSLRQIVLPSNAVESSEGEEEDEAISLSPSTLPSRYSKTPSKEEPRKKSEISLKTAQFDKNFESLKGDFETDLPSVENTLSPRASKSLPKRLSLQKHNMEQKMRPYRNVDSSETSNNADQTWGTLPKQKFTDGENSRQSKRSTRVSSLKADSVRKAESLNAYSMESEEESDERTTSSAAERKLSKNNSQGKKMTATAALSVRSANSISHYPSRSSIGRSPKTALRKRHEGTEAMSSKEVLHSNRTVTGKAAEWQKEAHEVSVSLQLKDDREKGTTATNCPKRKSSAEAAATLPEEGAMPPPPKKSVIPQRVRSDIRSFFVKSTPLKERQMDDSSDTLVPLNATAITPIKKSGALLAGGSLFPQGSSSSVAENLPEEDLNLKVGVLSRPTSSRVQELVKQLMEPVTRKKEEIVPLLPRPVRVLPNAKAKSPQKPAKKKFQLILPDGKVYKQPKLIKPRKFVSDKLYRFVTKNIKNNRQLDTRVRAEEFVRRLCDTYDRVLRRKNTKELVEDLLEDMVRLGLVSTYAEFYYFVEKFMPFSFRMKAIPCIGSDLAPKPRQGIYEKLEFD